MERSGFRVVLPPGRSRYGPRFAAWLIGRVDADPRYLSVVDEAVAVIGAAAAGRPVPASPVARAVLCDVEAVHAAFSRHGRVLAWHTAMVQAAGPTGGEEHRLAVLAVPNLTATDLRHLHPLRRTPTLGVTRALCAHPAISDPVVVDAVFDGWNQRTSVLPGIGALSVLAGHSPAGSAAVTLMASAARPGRGFSRPRFHHIVTLVAAGGPGACDRFARLLTTVDNNDLLYGTCRLHELARAATSR